ncbi:MAG: single-stranded DNA-binding protein [Tepidisphaeraceae bacterium]
MFIDCTGFGKTGQTIGENLTKGRPIHVEGRLKFEQWEQEDGQRRSKIRVVVEQFRFVDRKPGCGPTNGADKSRRERTTGRKGGRTTEQTPALGEPPMPTSKIHPDTATVF